MCRQPLPAAHDMKRLSLIMLLALASPAWADPIDDAAAANTRGDYATELRITRPLAESGTAWAQTFLGGSYDNGEGVPQDDQEAAKWYRLAAGQGYAPAQSNLGVMYENGEGVLQDYKEAVKWYRLAAEQGLGKGQSNLGDMYENGRGVVQDNIRAHMWFNLAAVSGDKGAIKNRDNMVSKMTPEQIGEAQKLARECQDRHFKGCSGSPPEVVQPTAIAPQRVATDSESKLGASLWWAIYGLGVLLWIPIQYLLMRKKFGETRFVDRSMWAMREEVGEHVRPWERFACVYLVPSLTVVSLALIFPLAMFFAARERIYAQR